MAIRSLPLRLMLGVLALAAGLFALLGWLSRTGQASPQAAAHPPMLGLMALEVQGPPELAWLGSGLPDALRLILARQPGIRVVDRQVVGGQRVRLGNPSLARLAHELRADYLLTGSLRVDPEGSWTLDLRLVKAPHDRVVWRTRERLPAGEAWTRLEPLSQAITRGVGALETWVAMSPSSLPRTQAAWESLTRGVDAQVEEDLKALEASLAHFRKAAEADPSYAPALAHLAYTLQETAQDANIQGQPQFMKPYFAQAREAAERAARLDPALGLAEKALAALTLAEGAFAQAEQHGRRAVELDPMDYHSLVILGDVFAWRGDARSTQAARNFYRSALAIAPSYWWGHFRLAVVDQLSGELEEAVTHADIGLILHPDTEFLYVTAADALFWLDRPQEALERVRAGLARSPGSPILRLLLVYGAYEIGDRATLEATAPLVMKAFAPAHPVHRWTRALTLLSRGQEAQALSLLDAFHAECRRLATQDQPSMDARIASVNLYFMGRTLAKRGHRDRADAFLQLAERLHPGKLGVSRKDPAYGAHPLPPRTAP